jgi:transcriptional regulator with XRE-family HTH domain
MAATYGAHGLSAIVADNVRLLCARRGVNQSDLARLLGLSRMSVSDRFRYKTPWAIDELGILAVWFGVPVSVLFGEQGQAVAQAPDLPVVKSRRRARSATPPVVSQLLPGLAYGRVG